MAGRCRSSAWSPPGRRGPDSPRIKERRPIGGKIGRRLLLRRPFRGDEAAVVLKCRWGSPYRQGNRTDIRSQLPDHFIYRNGVFSLANNCIPCIAESDALHETIAGQIRSCPQCLPLVDGAAWPSPARRAAKARQAAPKAAKSRCDTGLSAKRYSGCHCTPMQKMAIFSRTASICPSGAVASMPRARRHPVDALAVQRMRPALRHQPAGRVPAALAERDRMDRAILPLERIGRIGAMILAAGRLVHLPAANCRRAPQVQLLHAAADAQHRQAARAIARRISGKVVASRAGSIRLSSGGGGPS